MLNPANNPGLVSDCVTLLAAKDTLEGTNGNLNWSPDVRISSWDGVTIENNRVTRLDLDEHRLNGTIPPELGNLDNLLILSLDNRQLTDEIPPELGNLDNLIVLSLRNNQLKGEIPPELGNLDNLKGLYLDSNQLTGEIPPELGNLDNLTGLALAINQLTGEIPPELGNLDNLELLTLTVNQLTGEIPSELGNLDNLTVLYLSVNRLTGCIPASLRSPLEADEIDIGLPFCQIGTRNNPIPLGERFITDDGFSLWVEGVVKDATQIVLDEHPWNEPPSDGNQYFLAQIRVKNDSPEPREFEGYYGLRAVGKSSVEYDTDCGLTVIPDRFDTSRTIFEGGEISGNICFTVKSSDANSLVMYDKYASTNWTFMALR